VGVPGDLRSWSLVDLRTAMATVLTLVPLVVGTIWLIGVMAVCGIRFNPANILRCR